jgi:hypothetical protein
MSVSAVTWVFEQSPYKLASRLVHLAIADVVNDDNGWLLWATQSKIAKKALVSPATVSTTMNRMCKDGYLELVEKEPGRPAVYRFLRPNPSDSEGSPPQKEQNSAASPPAKATDDPIVAAAHKLTVLAMEQSVKPVLREDGKSPFGAVLKIIERLLRNGQSVQAIERAIKSGIEVWTVAGIQTAIAQTRGRKGNTTSALHERIRREDYGHQ